MGWAGEIADFSSSYERTRKKLQEADAVRKPKEPKAAPTADAAPQPALFGPPERVDNKDKGYSYSRGGMVRKR